MLLTAAQGRSSKHAAEISLLTFDVGRVSLAIDIRSTHEINRQSRIDRIPHAPSSLAGVINLRGQVVTVVDLGVLLGQPAAPRSGTLQILIASTDANERLGLLVDRVVDVVNVATSSLTAKPDHVAGVEACYFSHVLPRENDLLLILDLHRVACELDEVVANCCKPTND